MKFKFLTHIDLVKTAEVASGRLEAKTCVGQLQVINPLTKESSWYHGYVHFEHDDNGQRTSAPRVSDNGKLRINWREQKNDQANTTARRRPAARVVDADKVRDLVSTMPEKFSATEDEFDIPGFDEIPY